MRLYSLGMIVLSTFVAIICLIMLLCNVKDYMYPESDLKGHEYKEHINFEYYKQQELKRSTDSTKGGVDLTKLSEADWKARWELSRKLSIQQIIHANQSSFSTTLITFLAFLLLLGIHIPLYRKTKPITLTI